MARRVWRSHSGDASCRRYGVPQVGSVVSPGAESVECSGWSPPGGVLRLPQHHPMAGGTDAICTVQQMWQRVPTAAHRRYRH